MVVSIGKEHTVPAACFGTGYPASWKRHGISSANEAGYLQPLLSGIGALGQWCEWLAERAWGHWNRWTRAQPDERIWMCWKWVCGGNDFPMGLPKWLVITNAMRAPIIISSHCVPVWKWTCRAVQWYQTYLYNCPSLERKADLTPVLPGGHLIMPIVRVMGNVTFLSHSDFLKERFHQYNHT